MSVQVCKCSYVHVCVCLCEFRCGHACLYIRVCEQFCLYTDYTYVVSANIENVNIKVFQLLYVREKTNQIILI